MQHKNTTLLKTYKTHIMPLWKTQLTSESKDTTWTGECYLAFFTVNAFYPGVEVHHINKRSEPESSHVTKDRFHIPPLLKVLGFPVRSELSDSLGDRQDSVRTGLEGL